MKTLFIYNCKECPFCRDYVHSLYCGYSPAYDRYAPEKEIERNIESKKVLTGKIPAWCPLIDVDTRWGSPKEDGND